MYSNLAVVTENTDGVPDLIKDAMDARGIQSFRRLAVLLGVNPVTLMRMLRGESTITFPVAVGLTRVLGMSLDDLAREYGLTNLPL